MQAVIAQKVIMESQKSGLYQLGSRLSISDGGSTPLTHTCRSNSLNLVKHDNFDETNVNINVVDDSEIKQPPLVTVTNTPLSQHHTIKVQSVVVETSCLEKLCSPLVTKKALKPRYDDDFKSLSSSNSPISEGDVLQRTPTGFILNSTESNKWHSSCKIQESVAMEIASTMIDTQKDVNISQNDLQHSLDESNEINYTETSNEDFSHERSNQLVSNTSKNKNQIEGINASRNTEYKQCINRTLSSPLCSLQALGRPATDDVTSERAIKPNISKDDVTSASHAHPDELKDMSIFDYNKSEDHNEIIIREKNIHNLDDNICKENEDGDSVEHDKNMDRNKTLQTPEITIAPPQEQIIAVDSISEHSHTGYAPPCNTPHDDTVDVSLIPSGMNMLATKDTQSVLCSDKDDWSKAIHPVHCTKSLDLLATITASIQQSNLIDIVECTPTLEVNDFNKQDSVPIETDLSDKQWTKPLSDNDYVDLHITRQEIHPLQNEKNSAKEISTSNEEFNIDNSTISLKRKSLNRNRDHESTASENGLLLKEKSHLSEIKLQSSDPIQQPTAYEVLQHESISTIQKDVKIKTNNSIQSGRASSRNKKVTTFYFEESLAMPSSRPSKFFVQASKPSYSGKWDQILQKVISPAKKISPKSKTKGEKKGSSSQQTRDLSRQTNVGSVIKGKGRRSCVTNAELSTSPCVKNVRRRSVSCENQSQSVSQLDNLVSFNKNSNSFSKMKQEECDKGSVDYLDSKPDLQNKNTSNAGQKASEITTLLGENDPNATEKAIGEERLINKQTHVKAQLLSTPREEGVLTRRAAKRLSAESSVSRLAYNNATTNTQSVDPTSCSVVSDQNRTNIIVGQKLHKNTGKKLKNKKLGKKAKKFVNEKRFRPPTKSKLSIGTISVETSRSLQDLSDATISIQKSSRIKQVATRTIITRRDTQCLINGAIRSTSANSISLGDEQCVSKVNNTSEKKNNIDQTIGSASSTTENTPSLKRKKAAPNQSTYDSMKKKPSKSTKVGTRNEYKGGWRVVGDPFPYKAVSNGGYTVSFSVLLDKYDRYVASNRCERVNFGSTIDTAKVAIDEKIQELMKRGEDCTQLEPSVMLDIQDFKRSFKLFTAFEHQERLEREREKEEDKAAERRRLYNRRSHKKTDEEYESEQILKRQIIIEETHGKQVCEVTPCTAQCLVCHGREKKTESNVSTCIMPLYRKFDIDLAEDSDVDEKEDGISTTRKKSKRAGFVCQKGKLSLMALIELKTTLAFIEQYYFDNKFVWGIHLL